MTPAPTTTGASSAATTVYNDAMVSSLRPVSLTRDTVLVCYYCRIESRTNKPHPASLMKMTVSRIFIWVHVKKYVYHKRQGSLTRSQFKC